MKEVYEYLYENKIGIQELAKLVGVSRVYMGSLLNGRVPATTRSKYLINKALGKEIFPLTEEDYSRKYKKNAKKNDNEHVSENVIVLESPQQL